MVIALQWLLYLIDYYIWIIIEWGRLLHSEKRLSFNDHYICMTILLLLILLIFFFLSIIYLLIFYYYDYYNMNIILGWLLYANDYI